jgi:hypothetical protein
MPVKSRNCAALLAACMLLSAPAWAARPVPVFQVPVAGQSGPDLQQAMRDALVRATGRRRSASDPVFAGLIANAAKYVRRYEHGPQGQLWVVFNAAAVDRSIAALDRSIWNPNRPFTLVVVSPPVDQVDQAEDQAGLEQAAEARGLPISIVPLQVTDGSGNPLPREALLQMAHQYGAEQLLVGTPPAVDTGTAGTAAQDGTTQATGSAPAAAGAPAAPAVAVAPAASPSAPVAAPAASAATAPSQTDWQWTLYTNFATRSWSGSLTAGIDNTVDLLAPPAGPASANTPARTRVKIEGVSSLADYANIELMLGAVPGVSSASVSRISGDSVVFDLTVRGGDAALSRALAGSPRFVPAARAAQAGRGAGAPLVLRYRSG